MPSFGRSRLTGGPGSCHWSRVPIRHRDVAAISAGLGSRGAGGRWAGLRGHVACGGSGRNRLGARLPAGRSIRGRCLRGGLAFCWTEGPEALFRHGQLESMGDAPP